jgi:hypothetical protein
MTQTSIKLSPKSITDTTEELKITVAYKANKAVHDPVFGILIKNAVGTNILGTNTKVKNIFLGSLKAGTKGTVEWVVPNVFNDGEYWIDVAISHEDAVTQHDWWEDATGFVVYKEERTPYVVNPKLKVSIK